MRIKIPLVITIDIADSAAEVSVIDSHILDKSVNQLYLSTRSTHGLAQVGVKTIGELLDLPPKVLLKNKNVGIKSIREIQRCIKDVVGVMWGEKV